MSARPKKHNVHVVNRFGVDWNQFIYNPDERSVELLPNVYCWLQGVDADGQVRGQWLAEDGMGMGKAVAKDPISLYNVMALEPPQDKQDLFKAHYPHGYQIAWVEAKDVAGNKGLMEAYKRNQAAARKAGKK